MKIGKCKKMLKNNQLDAKIVDLFLDMNKKA